MISVEQEINTIDIYNKISLIVPQLHSDLVEIVLFDKKNITREQYEYLCQLQVINAAPYIRTRQADPTDIEELKYRAIYNIHQLMKCIEDLVASNQTSELNKRHLNYHWRMLYTIRESLSPTPTSEIKMSRRKFSSCALQLTATLAAALTGIGMRNIVVNSLEYKKANGLMIPEEVPAEIQAYLTFFKQAYGLDFYIGMPLTIDGLLTSAYVSAETPSFAEIFEIMPELYFSVTRYPLDFFKKNLHGEIRLVKNLKNFSKTTPGIQERDFLLTSESIFINVVDFNSTNNLESYNIFHHELGHEILDIGDNKKWFGMIENHLKCKPYDGDNPDSATCDPDLYTSNYGRTDCDEDFAEFCVTLFCPRAHANLIIKIEKLLDEKPDIGKVLRAKYEYVKQVYYDRSNGQMDGQYWNDLITEQVTPEYWLNRKIAKKAA